MIEHIILHNKEIYLVGTAHVSSESAAEVRRVVAEVVPDAIAIELDDGRYKAMTDGKSWEKTDITQIIKQKKVGFLLANILLSSYQDRLAKQMDVRVGEEMRTAIELATTLGLKVECIDRDIQTTFLRIWRTLRLKDKWNLLIALVSSVFEDEKISEQEIENLKQGDLIQAMISEFAGKFPSIVETLVYERDQVMAYQLKHNQSKKIVAVVGAAHVAGILKNIQLDYELAPLLALPPKSNTSKYASYLVPGILVLLLVVTSLKVPSLALSTILRFILVNGTFAALGTLVAFGHPLSILTAFVMAPVGALSPVLATGWFAGLMEAWVRKPKVEDFLRINIDASSFKGFWKNRVLRILLVVVLANLFATIGTLVISAELIGKIFH
ncbi:MAG: TraB/GumN family protein [Erysipelotrichaceae bacterium]